MHVQQIFEEYLKQCRYLSRYIQTINTMQEYTHTGPVDCNKPINGENLKGKTATVTKSINQSINQSIKAQLTCCSLTSCVWLCRRFIQLKQELEAKRRVGSLPGSIYIQRPFIKSAESAHSYKSNLYIRNQPIMIVVGCNAHLYLSLCSHFSKYVLFAQHVIIYFAMWWRVCLHFLTESGLSAMFMWIFPGNSTFFPAVGARKKQWLGESARITGSECWTWDVSNLHWNQTCVLTSDGQRNNMWSPGGIKSSFRPDSQHF